MRYAQVIYNEINAVFLQIEPKCASVCHWTYKYAQVNLNYLGLKFLKNTNTASKYINKRFRIGIKNASFKTPFHLWQLIDLDMSNFEYRVFVVVFYRQMEWKKPKQIQCNLDLVTLLVSAKTVTKSHNVTKSNDFM